MGRKIKVYVAVGVARSEAEYDLPDDWDQLTPEEQQAELDDAAENHLANHCEYGAYVEED